MHKYTDIGEKSLNRREFFSYSAAAMAAVSLSAALPRGLSVSANEGSGPLSPPEMAGAAFRSAKPIWPRGRDSEMNLFVGFRAVFDLPAGRQTFLRAAGATLYRAYINGTFCAWGPARGPHGYYRVDVWEITPWLVRGRNLVAIEVAGYNINSYWVLDQPSFLQAEVFADDEVLASTGGSGESFEATILPERVRKTQRYSFQRAFSEVYRLHPGSAKWRQREDAESAKALCKVCASRALIPRRVPYPAFLKRQPDRSTAEGSFQYGLPVPHPLKGRSLTAIGPRLRGFPESDLEVIPYLELQGTATTNRQPIDAPYQWDRPILLTAGRFHITDFGTDLSGFIGARVRARSSTKLYLTFDEMLTHGDVDFTRLGCVNILAYNLEVGVYDLESFEPYTLRFLKLMVIEGDCEVTHIHLREYAAQDVWTAQFESSDSALNRLFDAGRETYRQNAVDLFTDCPSRERSGWLCDSYFTAQVSPMLTGDTKVEQVFFENFLLPEHFAHLPAGMLPMCYPADHDDETFIPNWSLWFLLQLEQYENRSGNREMVEAFRPRVLKLLEYFTPFQNEDGLLENLSSWVFIEWSKANDYTAGVNYPTNMLYAAALAAVGRLYHLPQITHQAEAIQRAIRRQSFDGKFFVDNAVRRDGKIFVTENRSETCQYYAYYFGTATSEQYATLWEILLKDFGPQRDSTRTYSEIAPSNAFVGNFLRMELLSRAGLTEQLLHESRAYLLYMAERTGTLWENTTAEASLNQAFASHIVKTLYRDIFGAYDIDTVRKVIHLRFTECSIAWCQGRIPIPDGFLSMRWARTPDILTYQLDIPAGYAVAVENLSNLRISATQV
jgi:alpha-L-rhamnosidase